MQPPTLSLATRSPDLEDLIEETRCGADLKVVQESLRHASPRITMEVYAQALTQDKRNVQSKVVQMILPSTAPP